MYASKKLSLYFQFRSLSLKNFFILNFRNGILVEWCTPECNDDAKVFKGIFLRNLRYLMDDSSTTVAYKNQIKAYKEFLQSNSDSVWAKDRCEPENSKSNCTVVFSDGPSAHSNISGPVIITIMLSRIEDNNLNGKRPRTDW